MAQLSDRPSSEICRQMSGVRKVSNPPPPPDLPSQQFLADLLEEALSHPALEHPFLIRFAREKLSVEQIAAYATQHYFYSRRFAQNLAAVISNVDDELARTRLVENMYEEIGEPNRLRDRLHIVLLERGLVNATQVAAALEQAMKTAGTDPVQALIGNRVISREVVGQVVEESTRDASLLTHPALFRRFLESLGLGGEALASASPLPETEDFIREYDQVCRKVHWLEGLGALGPGTECVVPSLYQPILSGVLKSGLVSEEAAIFWTIHVHCDDGHGKNIVESLSPHAADSENQKRIRRGMLRVLEARKRWFDALEAHVFRDE